MGSRYRSGEVRVGALLRAGIPLAGVLLAGILPVVACAQGVPPEVRLAPHDAEAHGMSLTLASQCNPARHRQVQGSESMIEGAPAALMGTASYLRGAEGAFLVLEQYGQDLSGHCMVLAWFGEPLVPGTYRIRQLAHGTLEAEIHADDYSFYAMAAVGAGGRQAILVGRSGVVEIARVEQGRLAARFTLSGFSIEPGVVGARDFTWSGTFTAVEAD